MVHHADYLNGLDDRALCGVAIQDPTALTQADTADALCPDCEAQLVVYHLEWWRSRALAVTAELDALRVKYPELVQSADTESPDVPQQRSSRIRPMNQPQPRRRRSSTVRDGNSPSSVGKPTALSPSID